MTPYEKRILEIQRGLLDRVRVLRNIRPGALAAFVQRLVVSGDRRRIVRLESGLRVYLDPLTNLGESVLRDGAYESETADLLQRHLPVGGVFVDVGANEGYFSALASTFVGREGVVVAVEPQSRLRDIIEINLRINDANRFAIYRNALGGREGEVGRIHLWPEFNTGASGIARQYRFSREFEEFEYVSLARIVADQKLESIDLMKVDVEGFESEVVQSMLPECTEGRVRKLLLDYHRTVLEPRGVNPADIHRTLERAGFEPLQGDVAGFSGYVLYRHRSAAADAP